MTASDPSTPAPFTPAERDYIRRKLDMFFSMLPSVAEGFYLKTWRGGSQAGQPKVPQAAAGLLERGLLRLDRTGRHPPEAVKHYPEGLEDAFMRQAIALSRQAMDEGAGPPFGAVIVRDGQVIAEGYNNSFVTNDPTAHAEVVAIRRACEVVGSRSLRGCVIYSSAEPCPMCLGAIHWAGIGRVHYGNDRDAGAVAGFSDARLYREIALPVGERALPMVQHLADEARVVFDAWRNRMQS